MGEHSHTPGPWKITSDAGHPANIRITSTARRHIAKVYAESPARDLVCEANAHLIAAAPKLLEALTLIAGAPEPAVGERDSEPRWSPRQCRDIARAAINAASPAQTGEGA